MTHLLKKEIYQLYLQLWRLQLKVLDSDSNFET